MAGLLDRFRNRHLRNRIKNPIDEYWDRKLGVQTFGAHPGSGSFADGTANLPFVPSTYGDTFQYLRTVGINSDDVFVDLGAGYGRTVFAASWMGAKRSVGVDLVQALVDVADENLRHSKLRDRDIEFICQNALDFSDPEMTILYMFHPFGEAILKQVLANIEVTRLKDRKLRIVYANPVYDHVLAQAGWLRKTRHIGKPRDWLRGSGRFETALWESV